MILQKLTFNKTVTFFSMCFLLSMSCIGAIQIEKTNDSLNSDNLSFEIYFDEPSFTTIEQNQGIVHSIQINDLPVTQGINMPKLPVKPMRILLPYGAGVDEINVELIGVPIHFPNIFPERGSYLRKIDLGSTGLIDLSSNSKTDDGSLFSNQGIHYFRGFPILFCNLFPVKYDEKTNILSYYPAMKVSIDTIKEPASKTLRFKSSDRSIISSMVDNPSTLDTYPCPTDTNMMDDVTYLLITNDRLIKSGLEDNFQTLLNSKINKGINADFITVEKILSNPDFSVNGTWGDNNPSNPFYQQGITSNFDRFDDTAARIRNYIRYAYMQLGTEYVLLGGDGDVGNPEENIIPARGLFANESGLPLISNSLQTDEEADDIPSDVYYACLDGNFNMDLDEHFGESPDRNDVSSSDEADLLAEVYVGRAPVDSEKEVAYFVSKTLSYEYSRHPYLSKILFVGEYLGFPGVSAYGGNYKDLVRPYIPDTYSIDTLYDRDLPYQWNKYDLIEIINNATPHIINHDGHAYYAYNLKMHNPDVDLLSNTNTFFVYSHGCMAGGFDNPTGVDCIAERFTVETSHGAFAAIMNARYGLGSEDTLDSPSQALDESFFKAIFVENIRQIGRASHFSKEDHIWQINENGIRWVFYETNLFGDPEISIKESNPTPVDLSIEITWPDDSSGIYINNQKFLSLRFLKNPLIFGPIIFQVKATSDPPGNVYSVEFLLNDVSHHTDYSDPYSWTLDTPIKGKEELFSVVAHGYYGEEAVDDQIINVWIRS